jgi:hypothetical protein
MIIWRNRRMKLLENWKNSGKLNNVIKVRCVLLNLFYLCWTQVVHGLLCMSALPSVQNTERVANLCMVYSVCLPSVQNTERVANLCMVICIITVTVFVQSLKSYCIHIEDGHLLFWTDLNNFSNKNFDVLNLVIFVITCCREYLVCVICNCIFQFNIIFKSCTHIEDVLILYYFRQI